MVAVQVSDICVISHMADKSHLSFHPRFNWHFVLKHSVSVFFHSNESSHSSTSKIIVLCILIFGFSDRALEDK